jgi:hypothetical protein
MSFFIFQKNNDAIQGLYKIAENNDDLNSLNIIQSDYIIKEDSQLNFEAVKLGTKKIEGFQNNQIIYIDYIINFNSKIELKNYIDNFLGLIENFKKNNSSHKLFDRWNNYYNQLNSLNLNNITYPLNKSLEQHLKDSNQPFFNILQLP